MMCLQPCAARTIPPLVMMVGAPLSINSYRSFDVKSVLEKTQKSRSQTSQLKTLLAIRSQQILYFYDATII